MRGCGVALHARTTVLPLPHYRPRTLFTTPLRLHTTSPRPGSFRVCVTFATQIAPLSTFCTLICHLCHVIYTFSGSGPRGPYHMVWVPITPLPCLVLLHLHTFSTFPRYTRFIVHLVLHFTVYRTVHLSYGVGGYLWWFTLCLIGCIWLHLLSHLWVTQYNFITLWLCIYLVPFLRCICWCSAHIWVWALSPHILRLDHIGLLPLPLHLHFGLRLSWSTYLHLPLSSPLLTFLVFLLFHFGLVYIWLHLFGNLICYFGGIYPRQYLFIHSFPSLQHSLLATLRSHLIWLILFILHYTVDLHLYHTPDTDVDYIVVGYSDDLHTFVCIVVGMDMTVVIYTIFALPHIFWAYHTSFRILDLHLLTIWFRLHYVAFICYICSPFFGLFYIHWMVVAAQDYARASATTLHFMAPDFGLRFLHFARVCCHTSSLPAFCRHGLHTFTGLCIAFTTTFTLVLRCIFYLLCMNFHLLHSYFIGPLRNLPVTGRCCGYWTGLRCLPTLRFTLTVRYGPVDVGGLIDSVLYTLKFAACYISPLRDVAVVYARPVLLVVPTLQLFTRFVVTVVTLGYLLHGGCYWYIIS